MTSPRATAQSNLRISTERGDMDLTMIHQFLSEQSYWKQGVALDVVRKSVDNSLCFGGFVGIDQVAFASVITDYTAFAYLRDVFVLPAHRGRAYGKQLLQAILDHPELQSVRWLLRTGDAHELYRQFGFVPLDSNDVAIFMKRPAP